MKTLEHIKTMMDNDIINKWELRYFIPKNELIDFGLEKYADDYEPVEYNRENLLFMLKKHVSNAFDTALAQRGMSADYNYCIVRFYNWLLEEGLENFDQYAMYGLPLLKATALKYGWDNPIGEHTGAEDWYNSNDYRDDIK